MSAQLRRLLTFLLALLMSVNALGASIAQLAPSACCGDGSQNVATTEGSLLPCHAAPRAAEACDHDDPGPSDRADAGGPACDDQCVRCAAFHASSPAFLVATPGTQVAVPTSYGIPALQQGALPALRAERLDRPPATVPLN
jgi:hypothetical protein